MIHKCPTCAAALRFNPTLNKLECLSCGNKYDPNQFENKDTNDVANTVTSGSSSETMECNIYSCTACGAELAVNGVESSTFCAYCGQPTIIFNRVSKELKPKYIIPFRISKEQAVHSIRQHLSRGGFVPDEIKNFEVERVRGIYIPFFLSDIDYKDQQYLKGTVKYGKQDVTYYYYRDGECSFRNITVDASNQLSDEATQRLEPYDISSLVPFETTYLSGFYADCFDVTKKDIERLSVKRVEELFDKEMEKTVSAKNVTAVLKRPRHRINRSSYAMFPAWFMTFRHNDEPYTILVNGQTGKIVGAVPYHQKKVNAHFVKFGFLFSAIASFVIFIMMLLGLASGHLFLLIIGISIFLFANGSSTYKKVRANISLSNSSIMTDYVKNRQEGN